MKVLDEREIASLALVANSKDYAKNCEKVEPRTLELNCTLCFHVNTWARAICDTLHSAWLGNANRTYPVAFYDAGRFNRSHN
jgi:hypothetical protein